MPTIEVIKFRDKLPITSVPGFVPGFQGEAIEITGQDLSNADRVIINEVDSPEFVIMNKSLIIAQLPETAKKRVATIEVVSSKFTQTEEASAIAFELGNKTRTVTGILRLVQLFMKWMLQTPGSDIFNPSRGGGLQRYAGRLVSSKRMEPLMAAITKSVSTTTAQIRSAQLGIPGLSLDEKLLSAEMTTMQFYEKQMEARIKVRIRAVSGRNALSSIQL